MIYNVQTKYRMSGTIRFVLLMQHKGIVLLLSNIFKSFKMSICFWTESGIQEDQKDPAWFSLVQ